MLIPVIAALAIICLWDLRRPKDIRVVTCGALSVTAVILWYLAVTGQSSETLTLFSLTDDFSVAFSADPFGRYFAAVMVTVWLTVLLFLSLCMETFRHEPRFFVFSLLIPSAIIGFSWASNFMTMFLFFEAAVLMFLPLVLHYQTEDSAETGRKYFMTAFIGGLISLVGACCFAQYVSGLEYVSGGALNASFAGGGNRWIILVSAFLMCAGFCVTSQASAYAGWLPDVERDVPVTVQALGAGVMSKLGLFGAIRSAYYLVGDGYLFASGAQIFLIVFSVLAAGCGIFFALRAGRREDERLGKTGAGKKYMNSKRMIYIIATQTGYAFLLAAIFQTAGLYAAIAYAAVHTVLTVLLPCRSLMKE